METISEADVVLALGCTFNQVTTASYTNRVIPAGARIIQVDIDPTEFGVNFPIKVGIVGDLKPVLQEMIEKLAPEAPRADKEERLRKIQKGRKAWEERLLSGGR